jgi:hypothetical protein
MSKSKKKNSTRPAVATQQMPDEDNPLVQILKNINAKMNKYGTEVVLTYKGHKVILPTVSQLPYKVFAEWFDNFDNQKTGEMIPAMARYFNENIEDFQAIVEESKTQEVMAVTLAWWNATKNTDDLGK